MKRRKFQWIWLFLGAILISGTCGFGYEAKRTRSQFEEAKDAFSRNDWEKVIDHLTPTPDIGRPSPKAFAAFLHRYVDPELASHEYKIESVETKSSLVPINNEYIGYREEGARQPLVMLRYVDDSVWFDIPFSTRKMGIFRGKLINMSFVSTFARVCRSSYPQTDRANSWKSVRKFVEAEKHHLDDMGITPANLYSRATTWDDYVNDYEDRVKKWRDSQRI